MHDVPLLVNLAVALGYALIGGLLARWIGLPTIVGYLVAGIAMGPFTPGFRADDASIRQMAEFGVILLMFGVGLHFSFRDLWQVRWVAIPGAVLGMAVVTVIGAVVARQLWGMTSGAWILGVALSVTSTVVLMRTLMDQGWLETPAGKVAVGWLVVEDLLTVAVLVLLPTLAAPEGASWGASLLAVALALLFVVLMMLAGDYVVPVLLSRVVHLRSRELFVLAALTLAIGTALASSAYFGVSLALGAFVAGLVVGESPFSHQVGADLLPFREAFAVIFFVSVGMLVDPALLLAQWDRVLMVALIVIVLKGALSGLIALALRCTGRTVLVAAAGRGQVGEFSFIIGQSGVALGALDQAQYSLILAGAILSITINPLVVRLVDPAERWLKRRGWWTIIDAGARASAGLADPDPDISGHVVIVGCGRVGRHIAEALGRLGIPRLVVEADPIRIDKLRTLGVPVLYGDASSSDILATAHLVKARALVITLPDDPAALAVVATAKKYAPDVPIVARASTYEGAKRLIADGANHVVRPELEGGVEIVRRTLLDLDLPVREVQRYTDLVRREGLGESERPSPEQARVLDDLVQSTKDLEVGWLTVEAGSAVAGRALADTLLRATAGVTVVAIARQQDLIRNPGPREVLEAGDRVAVIGSPAQVAAAEKFFEHFH
jgi:CPA2 family monovalent cation:H+ antiporter-2